MVWAEGKPTGAGTTHEGALTFKPGQYVLVRGLRYICPYVREQRIDMRKPRFIGRPLLDVLCEMFRPPPWCNGIAPGINPWQQEGITLDEYTKQQWIAHFRANMVFVRRHKTHKEDVVAFEVSSTARRTGL